MHWQLQDAKQRFSELIRSTEEEGAQYVTRHGQEVAVVIDIEEYRRLKGERQDLKDFLLAAPDWDDFAEELDNVVAERGLPRSVDLGDA